MLTKEKFINLIYDFEDIRFKEENKDWENLFLETISLLFPRPQEFLNKTREFLRTGKTVFITISSNNNTTTEIKYWEELYECLMTSN